MGTLLNFFFNNYKDIAKITGIYKNLLGNEQLLYKFCHPDSK